MRSLSSRASWRRRARPLLGTLVEIRAFAAPAVAERAVAAAFAAVAAVHRLMSAHERESDVGRLNRFARRRAVRVDAQTWRVLQAARRISAASDGAFDVCVAPWLARRGQLPPWVGRRRDPGATWQAIELLPDRRVRFATALAVDPGGIAKGYAVERAAAALRANAVPCHVVNAGGDLRIGASPQAVHVRDPRSPARLRPLAELCEAAMATSAAYFAPRGRHAEPLHSIVDPRTGARARLKGSITVLAADCMVADALTKVVAVLGEESAATLAGFGAEACLLSSRGHFVRLGAPSHR